MSRPHLRKLLVLSLASLLLGALWAPGSRAATASEKRYAEAVAVETRGDLDGAEALYRKLAADYPESGEAAGAFRQIERIQQRRKQLHKEQFMPVLHRLQKIVESYEGVTGRAPRELRDFDRDDSLFDSDHLSGLIPEGFVVYLHLPQGEGNFAIHALQDGSATGYRVDRTSATLQPVDGGEFQTRLEKEWKVTERKGNLILVQPK